jgi:hypothetical protein
MKSHHGPSQRGVESLAVDSTPVVHPYSGCKRKIMVAGIGEARGSIPKSQNLLDIQDAFSYKQPTKKQVLIMSAYRVSPGKADRNFCDRKDVDIMISKLTDMVAVNTPPHASTISSSPNWPNVATPNPAP